MNERRHCDLRNDTRMHFAWNKNPIADWYTVLSLAVNNMKWNGKGTIETVGQKLISVGEGATSDGEKNPNYLLMNETCARRFSVEWFQLIY